MNFPKVVPRSPRMLNRQGKKISVMTVENRIPNESDTAMGTTIWAAIEVSNNTGVSPKNVVNDVRRMGLNRTAPASTAASDAL